MRYKVKWRSESEQPLQPEVFDSEDTAKARTRELLTKYGSRMAIEIWNEDETWRIVTPAGIEDWCEAS